LRLQQFSKALAREKLLATPGLKLCEIGPGMGDATSLVLDDLKVASADLYESSVDSIGLLQSRFGKTSGVEVHGQFESTPAEYDLILAFEVLEHIEDDVGFMEKIAESINEKGVFIGSVPAYMKKWQTGDEWAGHFRRYEKDELLEKLHGVGFKDVEISTYGFPLTNLLYPLRQLYYGLSMNKERVESKQTATEKSGVSREFVGFFHSGLVYWVVRFFALFQAIPVFRNFGDGFLFVCKK